jgi:hypothetical protein
MKSGSAVLADRSARCRTRSSTLRKRRLRSSRRRLHRPPPRRASRSGNPGRSPRHGCPGMQRARRTSRPSRWSDGTDRRSHSSDPGRSTGLRRSGRSRIQHRRRKLFRWHAWVRAALIRICRHRLPVVLAASQPRWPSPAPVKCSAPGSRAPRSVHDPDCMRRASTRATLQASALLPPPIVSRESSVQEPWCSAMRMTAAAHGIPTKLQ